VRSFDNRFQIVVRQSKSDDSDEFLGFGQDLHDCIFDIFESRVAVLRANFDLGNLLVTIPQKILQRMDVALTSNGHRINRQLANRRELELLDALQELLVSLIRMADVEFMLAVKEGLLIVNQVMSLFNFLFVVHPLDHFIEVGKLLLVLAPQLLVDVREQVLPVVELPEVRKHSAENAEFAEHSFVSVN